MATAIQVLGGLLIAGGFAWMMWGGILVLKEAYKESVLWLIGCIAIPIVLAYFVVKHPDRVHAARMKMAKGLIPFVLGIALIAWLAPPTRKAAAKAQEKASPAFAAVAASVPAVVAAPAPAPKPADPAPKAGTPAPTPAPAEPAKPVARVIDQKAHDQAILTDCGTELGLYCNSVKDDARAAKACLANYSGSLLAKCKAAWRDRSP